jgi:hypothetical protein
MKYAVESCHGTHAHAHTHKHSHSRAHTHTHTCFINFDSGIRKLIGEIHGQHGDLISLP